MKHYGYIFILLLILNGCVTEFIPLTTEDKGILVVEGIITDQPGVNIIKLSKSTPIGTKNRANPVTGYHVFITDDLDNTYSLTETTKGTYTTNAAKFQGVVGRFYTLHIISNDAKAITYESFPAEMRPVPAIDTLYYKKSITRIENGFFPKEHEGADVYLSTHDATNNCKFYRWEYAETWEIHIPYPKAINGTCWVTGYSDKINIKSTSNLAEDAITGYHLNQITDESDRLSIKYSMLVTQYSLNEDEYNYWEKLQKVTDRVGSLYDVIPSYISSNVYCVDNPDVKVLGYFSVSASSSKRLFIEDYFPGLYDPYSFDRCGSVTIPFNITLTNLNTLVWILIEFPYPPNPYRIITTTKGCADCTVRGTTTKPDFWESK